jgi:pimeloyl-ACP methyl ester carboxylesterase
VTHAATVVKGNAIMPGRADELKGPVKETLGKVCSDEQMKAEGQASLARGVLAMFAYDATAALPGIDVPALPGIDVPALVITGDKDRAPPSGAARRRSRWPRRRCRCTGRPGTGSIARHAPRRRARLDGGRRGRCG